MTTLPTANEAMLSSILDKCTRVGPTLIPTEIKTKDELIAYADSENKLLRARLQKLEEELKERDRNGTSPLVTGMRYGFRALKSLMTP
jgi:hypothetical protein